MAYTVTLKKRAVKALEKISNPFYFNIKEAIFGLVDNPRPFGYQKLKGRDGFRIRVGDYRIIYDIFDDSLVVNIIDIGHRRNIYE